jgi:hypothetical protein
VEGLYEEVTVSLTHLLSLSDGVEERVYAEKVDEMEVHMLGVLLGE